MASAPNVLGLEKPVPQSSERPLLLFARVSSRDYRAAVAQLIRELKAERSYSNERLAEVAGCSESTIFNAENENGNLDPVTLLNIALPHGGERRLRRILALINGNADAAPETVTEKRRRLLRELQALEDDQ